MRKRLKRLAIFTGIFLSCGMAFAYWLYYSVQEAPSFYRKALVVPQADQKEKSDQFLEQALALASTLKEPDPWQVVFTTEEINAWLACDLVRNHARLLPDEMRDPRVSLEPNCATLACTWNYRGIDTVVSLAVDVFVSSPGELAIRFQKARMGKVPVPMTRVLESVTKAATAADLPIQWQQHSGTPTAIIRLADAVSEGTAKLTSVELRSGEVLILGSSEGEKPSESRPPIHQPPANTQEDSKSAAESSEKIHR